MRSVAVAVVLLVAALLLPSGASAAQLTLAGRPSFSASTVTRCDDAVAATTPTTSGTTTSVVLSGIDAACAGRPVVVRVWDPAAAATSPARLTAQGTVPAAGGSVTLTGSPGFRPEADLRANVVLGAWPVPATWTYGPPPLGTCRPVDPAVTATCEVVLDGWAGYLYWGSGYRVRLVVRTSSPTPFVWEATIDLSATGIPTPAGQEAFPGWPVPGTVWQAPWYPSRFTSENLCFVSTGTELPVLRFRGERTWSRTVSASAPVSSLGIQAQSSGGSTIDSQRCG
ncbi:hypothetical protein [Cellulomonas fimi]|uniref:Uncharacterized protein n=1 Tax=Cellulomonas fimi TaxID=1708 RepID=A0A7Y0QHI0_CELFI|nr:hypothetical protein [Cellulomonas fimi]NMR20310.1 hypothetical protein [Cellulomonas fimi]